MLVVAELVELIDIVDLDEWFWIHTWHDDPLGAYIFVELTDDIECISGAEITFRTIDSISAEGEIGTILSDECFFKVFGDFYEDVSLIFLDPLKAFVARL